MKTILYSVFESSHGTPTFTLQGVDGQPVRALEDGALCAAISSIDEPASMATLERIKAYERVVAALFEERTLIPMRFGSVLADEEGVRGYLRERRAELESLLRAIDGCVEMGIRVLEPPAHPTSSSARMSPRQAMGPGAAYLAGLREKYAIPDQSWQAELIERYRRALAELYVQWKAEGPLVTLNLRASEQGLQIAAVESGAQGRVEHPAMLSLYFLVKRSGVGAFRRSFDQLRTLESATLSLSGPWPPYNFVTS